AAALTKSFTAAAPLGGREAAMKASLFRKVGLRSLYLGGGRLVAGPLIALFLLVTHHTLSHVELVERVDLAQVVEGSRGEEQDVGDQIPTVELERHQPVHGLHAFLRGTEAVLAEAGGLVG